MNTKELRIGNFVNDTDDTFHIVSAVYRNGIEMEFNDLRYFIDEDVVRPIPFTEEWILKFGLGKENGYPYKFINGFLKIRNGIYFFKYYDLEVDLPFVHQIQNLYFDLKGVELQLSST